MVNAYNLNGRVFEWNEKYKVYACSHPRLDVEMSLHEGDLIFLGATPIENESECECACHWTKGDKPFHRYGQCKCEKPEREDENTKEEHEKIKGYVLSKAVREAEREEIDPPEQVTYARDTEIYPDFERWYRQVTNMLNRHEQLLREGE
jgi:hypothetical protein